MIVRFLRLSLFALLAFSLGAPAQADEARTRAVGGDGTVFEVLDGLAGELFPDHGSLVPGHRVLAFDVTPPESEKTRWLVPGTEGASSETDYLVVSDEETGSAFVLYQGWYNDLHPLIRLVRFDESGWGELVDVVSNPFATKLTPCLLLTREEKTPAGPRTAIHLVWAEDLGSVRRTLHGLVLLQGGDYLGWSPIFDLGSLIGDQDPAQSDLEPWVSGIFSATSGTDRSAMVVGFVEPIRSRLLTVEIQMLPWALADLAERARIEIIGIGWRSASPENLQARLLALETGLHPAVVSYLAAHVAELAAAEESLASEDDLIAFAERARIEIIGIGSRVGLGAVEQPVATRLFEIGQTPEGGAPHHLMKSTVRLDLPAPESVGEGARLLVSPSAEKVMVVWPENGKLVFLAGSSDGWAERATLDLRQLGLDLDEGIALLETQVADS